MKNLPKAIAALLLSAGVPAMLLLVWLLGAKGFDPSWLPFVCMMAYVVALGHALVFGLPYALLLHKTGHFGWVPMLLGGFVIGFTPAAVFDWPDKEGALVFGGLGVAASAAFFVLYRYLLSRN